MSASAFLARTAPLELLQEILYYSQSQKDLFSFAGTCRHMRQAWNSNDAGLRTAWRLLAKNVPASEQALIAHRASQAVLAAERLRRCPPKTLELDEMSSDKRHADFHELIAVENLHKLATAVENVLCNSDYAVPQDVEGQDTPEEPARMGEWSVNVHKAIYRSFITGAALAGIYKEPYLEAALKHDVNLSAEDEEGILGRRNFLNCFPAFRWAMTESEQNEAFGSYGKWLLAELCSDIPAQTSMEFRFATDTGRAVSCQERKNEDGSCPVQLVAGGTHEKAHSVALELMRLLWASTQVLTALVSKDRKSSLVTTVCDPIVPYGRFSSWVAGLALAEAAANDAPSIASLGRPEGVGSEIDDYPWIDERIDAFGGHGITPVPEANEPYPPLPGAHFFAYFLRKHMGLAFHNTFFRPDEGREIDNNWQAFSESLLIFSLDDVDEREAFYPEYASMACFPPNGFLDGGDLLVSCDSLDDTQQ